MKSKEIKKSASLVEWRKGKGECEFRGYVNGTKVFGLYEYTPTSIALYFEISDWSSCYMYKMYLSKKSAKRGAERLARRLAAVFGKAEK